MDPLEQDRYYYYQQFSSPQVNRGMIYPYPKPSFKMNLQKTIYYAGKGINTVNQLIPLIHQVQPLIRNTMKGIAIIKALREFDDIDLDEVTSHIHPETNIENENDNEVKFENMI